MKVYNEEDYLMLSGIQHFAFCPRQWALIHIENQWEENVRTVEGNIMHKRAHDGPQIETRKNLVVSRQMKVYSKYLGISGICDVVEFKKCKKGEEGVHLYGREGLYKVHPVEYKKGEPKENNADRLQLVAQAICLEEMLSCPPIPTAYLYYMETKRRESVALSPELRNEVERMLTEMRALYDRGYTPKVKQTAKCRACSLADICLPRLQKCRSASAYTQDIWKDGEDNV